jgi:CRISPR/Cas system-associated exonuclease Cas4 (RecB family)
LKLWISRDEYPEIAAKLKEIMVKRLTDREPPTTIWFTDTVYCGRKKIFRMLMGGQEPMTERSLNKVWLGLVFERELEALGLATQVPVKYRGMNGRIDVLLETGEPMEVKTTLNLYVPASNYAETHIEQLSRYCLAVGKETGVIFYYIPGIAIGNLPAYRYRFDLEAVKKVTDERLDLLEQAVKLQNPFILPTTWHSQTMDNWECKECLFQQICRGREHG